MGILQEPVDRNIFPKREHEKLEFTPADLLDEAANHGDSVRVHPAASDDEDAWTQIRLFVALGFLLEFKSYADIVAFLGRDPVVSPFIVLVKERGDRIKRRIILNLKKSGISAASRNAESHVAPH